MNSVLVDRGVQVSVEEKILTPGALDFLGALHREFSGRLASVLEMRKGFLENFRDGDQYRYLDDTRWIRESDWTVAEVPKDLVDRRVEITGPVDAKMIINAMNSGARVFMADFEDANSPTWENNVRGQENLMAAVRRTLSWTSPDGREYRLVPDVATLVVRPRGLHLSEKHLRVGGERIPASLFDFGLYLFHNAHELLARGSGPYFYLPKLETWMEAQWWSDVLRFSESALNLPRQSIKVTMLIETITGALQMDEFLYYLKPYAVALNAGRWDYIFSIIKRFNDQPAFMLPDRSQVTMTVPFMRAYARRLVSVCHRRGAHAIGGMSAFIPSRRDSAVNERAILQVKADKLREANDGFDGTWVAHPDLVATALGSFESVLGTRVHQKLVEGDGALISASQLVDFEVSGGSVTDDGVWGNIMVSLQYLESWLAGNGAVAINNLMEDAATAEISRSQLWLWIKRGAVTAEGSRVTFERVASELRKARATLAAQVPGDGSRLERLDKAAAILEQILSGSELPSFLTIPAYELID